MVRSVRFSPDARLIVSFSEDNTIKIWDVNKYVTVTIHKGYLQPISLFWLSLDVTCVTSCINNKK